MVNDRIEFQRREGNRDDASRFYRTGDYLRARFTQLDIDRIFNGARNVAFSNPVRRCVARRHSRVNGRDRRDNGRAGYGRGLEQCATRWRYHSRRHGIAFGRRAAQRGIALNRVIRR